MALQTTTLISIGGSQIPSFKTLELKQSIADHHTLEILCRMDVLENLENELSETSKNFLGEIVVVETTAYEGFEANYGSLEFKGIVTEVQSLKGYDASEGDLVKIIAKSTTIICDDGVHYVSYNDVDLAEIISSTLGDYNTSVLTTDIRPQNNPTIHYAVQYNESSFAFVRRMAARYGVWMYYNGKQLVFGSPESKEIELTYGFDLKHYNFKLAPQSNNYSFFVKDYLNDENIQKSSNEVSADEKGYAAFVSNKSKQIFNNETRVWHNAYNDDATHLRFDKAIETQKKAVSSKQVQLSAVSDNPAVIVGGIVIIEGTKYRVLSIEHKTNEIGSYSNEFTGISANTDAYPYTDINAFAKAEPQVAVVKENNDPLGLGRVRVQFTWQQDDNELTPWLRMVTPHAGNNKGFYFVCEIDEEIMVGFEGNNIEKPFVMGSLYNGSKGANAFQTENNDIKAIKTKSGHIIEFNDTENAESISIKDKSGNLIHFNTKESAITISAPENMKIMAKNLDVLVQEDFTITTGKNKREQISGDHRVKATNIIQIADEDIKNEAEEILTQAENEIDLVAKGNINKQADKKINNSSGDQSNMF